ncbi:aminodeoxychorismate synthase component I [Lewinella sp. IMCC34183]|uniref:aminodeoxychorismate synthase component I n=1 Tax=Lewinella sp. IMCC34183 TaxID=2248762 RepID=UPI000E232EC1|nr:aminodeoxychorismate synthase component I [Lewinella sp. IMCC34183]
MPHQPSADLRDWSGRLNRLAAAGRPCFFLLDFELRQPRLWTLDQLPDAGVRFAFPGHPDPLRTAPRPGKLHGPGPDRQAYAAAYAAVQAGLRHGDSFLTNLTFPSPVDFAGTLTAAYEHAAATYRVLLPGRFACFSPESFVKVTAAGRIETRPMKGTAPDTAAGRAALLGSTKEIAEHATIVDLMRNDLSQLAREVRVLEYRYLDSTEAGAAGLLQSSSRIGGQLPSDWRERLGDWLLQLLPAGSVSGAPKPATLDLIRRAEGGPRGYYCGVAGYFDGAELDSCVLIRFLERRADGGFMFRSGGGITARSTEAEEYAELLAKIRLPLGKYV